MTSIYPRRSFKLIQSYSKLLRCYSNIHVPFQDDLSDIDMDDFGLGDFKHYQESSDILKRKNKLYDGIDGKTEIKPKQQTQQTQQNALSLESMASLKEPSIFISKLNDPYLNLAIEDYIYNKMPLPSTTSKFNSERLLFYINSSCVIIGKNQNPWKEVNLPILNHLKNYPLIRRKSGGGTVVHDLGNVNFSFMTSKLNFDRFKFVNLVVDSVNNSKNASKKLEVNKRGDIVTKDGGDEELKISGSAYKLSKGKSYHHSTMLLNSNLKNLRRILHRDEKDLGVVDSKSSISSVKSKVTNLEIDSNKFIEIVSNGFKQEFGLTSEDQEELEQDEETKEFNEIMGLSDFASSIKSTNVFEITSNINLPQEVIDTSNELKTWNWKFGHTPPFHHYLVNDKLGIKLKFYIEKGKIIQIDWELVEPNEEIEFALCKFEEVAIGIEYRGDLIYDLFKFQYMKISRRIGLWLSRSIDGLHNQGEV
ncbi:uncharacterized protein KGF55_002972 [Candida pseudojiufengensis]|uniref:uncharacterized protein n=1 Tax=Candida pseudojiufengensis TaxID=497109 RepID=UPI0022249761|nr:uncharacterized protein KGF55_002972 [Candida pseudojiufengensis]KAI5963180.1 hypothetical protein KGF55_002972 [Candida pseudojiufengensis]